MSNKKTVFEGMISECYASIVLLAKNEENKAYNQGLARAISIIKSYEAGNGIFQLGESERENEKS